MIKQVMSAVLCAGFLVGGFGVESARAEEYTELEVYGVNQISEMEYRESGRHLSLPEKKAVVGLSRGYCSFRSKGQSMRECLELALIQAIKISEGNSAKKQYFRNLATDAVVLGHNYLCPQHKPSDW